MQSAKSSLRMPQVSNDPQPFRDAQLFWDLILRDLALQMTQAAFQAWLQPTRAIGLADGVLSVQVPNERIKEWLEHRLCGKIRETVDYFASDALEIRFVADPAHWDTAPFHYVTRLPSQNAQQTRHRPRATQAKGSPALKRRPGRPKTRAHTTQ